MWKGGLNGTTVNIVEDVSKIVDFVDNDYVNCNAQLITAN